VENHSRLRALQFLSIALTALALVPSAAHLFALPNKISMTRDAYFVAQSIYRGWALFGIIIFPACATLLALAYTVRTDAASRNLALLALALLLIGLAVFFTWTFPANQATHNWEIVPENWQTLRAQWEYSHAANAVLTFLALCCVIASVVAGRR
jgi:hypothetical protein